jgi:Flp pilus assembly protein TadD
MRHAPRLFVLAVLAAAWPSLRAQAPPHAPTSSSAPAAAAEPVAQPPASPPSPAPLAAGSARPSPPAVLEDAARANNLGVARLEQYDYAAAVNEFQRAIGLAGDFALPRVNLAIALFYQGNHADAEREARAALVQMPDSPQAHYVLGLIARAANEQEKATEAFRRVLAIDADDAGAKIGLGQVLLQQRQFDEAATLFEAAAKAEPFNTTAAYNLGVALTRAGRADEGRAAMARFQVLREGGQGLGYSSNYMEQGRYAEALVTTGLEAGLVSRATPAVRFVPSRLETSATAATRQGTAGPQAAHRVGAPASGRGPAAGATGAVSGTGATGTGEGATGTGMGSTGGAQSVSDARPSTPTLADLDRDGDLDLIVTGPRGAMLRNDGGRFTPWGDTGIAADVLREAAGAVVADWDNDGVPDLVLPGRAGVALFRQDTPGHFEDRTAASGLAAVKAAMQTAALADVDHDGDVDLVVGGASGLALLRNNGDGTFTDITADAKVAITSAVTSIVPTDLDNRRDLDLLVVSAGEGVRVLRNQRDGTFVDQAERFGLGAAAGVAATAAADVNKDDLPDVVLGGASLDVALSRGSAALTRRAASKVGGVTAVQALDYDSDGLLDLLALSPAGLHVLRFVGDGWTDVTSAAVPPSAWAVMAKADGPPAAIASGDLDADGDTDLVLGHASGAVTVAINEGGSAHRAQALRLTGRVSNRGAAGAKIEVRAGSLRQRVETMAATPAPVPADVLFGLGGRAAADVVRVIWPSGIVQAEVLEGATPTSPGARVASIALTELDRKPSSCPFLYTWNGERFQFVTDFLGAGEMGYWVAPGVRSFPDPDEYVRIPPGMLVARDGRYDIRVTNELEETVYLDRVQLLSVSHPPGTEVFPNEGMRSGPQAPFTLYVVSDARPVRRAIDASGQDATDRLARIDRQHAEGLPLLPIRGYAEPHALTLDLGEVGAWVGPGVPGPYGGGDRAGGGDVVGAGHARPVTAPARPVADPPNRLLLLLTGWTDYAFSSDNVAAAQAGLALRPPSLQVRDATGAWRTVIDQIGVPVGRPQTVVVDLTGKFLSASREVRVVTSMRVYWDEARVATNASVLTPDPARAVFEAQVPAGPVVVRRLEPLRADLGWRGFSRELTQRAYGLWPKAYGTGASGELTQRAYGLWPVASGELRQRAYGLRPKAYGTGASGELTQGAYGLWPKAYGTGADRANATGAVPTTYDYGQVSIVSPWKQMPGRYTREGDVLELVSATDDMFIVSRPGDEIAVSFPSDGNRGREVFRDPSPGEILPVPFSGAGVELPDGAGADGQTVGAAPRAARDIAALSRAPDATPVQTLFLFAHGYSKEMDINSASPDQAAPLPFRGMTQYPYAAPEAYPSTGAHRNYLDRYNTRVVGRPLPPIEAAFP